MAISQRWLNIVMQDLTRADQTYTQIQRLLGQLRTNRSFPREATDLLSAMDSRMTHIRNAIGNLRHAHVDEAAGR